MIMRATLKADQEFVPFGALAGLGKVDFWSGRHDVSFQLVKVKQGPFPPHTHDSWEAMYVTAGRIRIGDTVFEPGDFLFTEPGETHGGEVLEDTTVLLGVGKD